MPWLTYPAISFLDQLKLENLSVVEFGGGASTIYFQNRGCSVATIEDDEAWALSLSAAASSNTKVWSISQLVNDQVLASLSVDGEGQLAEKNLINGIAASFSLSELDAARALGRIRALVHKADIVVVDGGPRSIFVELLALGQSSALILIDNSEQDNLKYSINALREAGYTQIPFRGLSPLNPYESETSCFANAGGFSRLSELAVDS